MPANKTCQKSVVKKTPQTHREPCGQPVVEGEDLCRRHLTLRQKQAAEYEERMTDYELKDVAIYAGALTYARHAFEEAIVEAHLGGYEAVVIAERAGLTAEQVQEIIDAADVAEEVEDDAS